MKNLYLSISSILFFLISSIPTISKGQITAYRLTTISGLTYGSISGGTVINDTSQLSPGQSKTANDGSVLVTLPFAFEFDEISYSQVTFNTNGWIAMGNQTTTVAPAESRSSSSLFSTSRPKNMVAAWLKDGNANFPSPAGVGSLVHGLTDTEVYAFEWKMVTGSGNGLTTTNTISFMIKLYGPGSVNPGFIEIIYGPQAGTFLASAAIGIKDSIGGTGHYSNALNRINSSPTVATAWPGNGFSYRFAPPPPCTGIPFAGATKSNSINPICASRLFILSVDASSGLQSTKYQWQSSIDSITWTDIYDAIGFHYTVTNGITTPLYFRQKSSCGSNVTYSTPLYIKVREPLLCYCIKDASGNSIQGSSSGNFITDVSIPGTTLKNNPSNGTGELMQFNDTGIATGTLQRGLSYCLVTKIYNSSDVSVWFDWNKNGVFEASEWIPITRGGSTIHNSIISFTVPANATLGLIGMRIRSRVPNNGNGQYDACTRFESGQTQDYFITITSAQPCSGIPVPSTVDGFKAVCPNSVVKLYAYGHTAASGIDLQWQSSPVGANNWTNIPGATVNTFDARQNAATDYRVVVSCNGSNPTAGQPFTLNMEVAGCITNDEPCNATLLYITTDNFYCPTKEPGVQMEQLPQLAWAIQILLPVTLSLLLKMYGIL
jgi:hypothetical protein